MKINPSIVTKFNSFLRIGNPEKVCSAKQKKYKFINDYLINMKVITIKETYLSVRKLASKYEVTPMTASNWIKNLIKLRILICTDSSYKTGSYPKKYMLTDFGRELVNEFNGYNELLKKNQDKFDRNKKKQEIRKEKWKKLDKFHYTMNDCVKLCSSYLGCPESLVKDMKSNLNHGFLCIPRENNIKESKYLDYYYAYNYCINSWNELYQTDFPKLKKKHYVKLLEKHYGQSIDLEFYFMGGGQFNSDIKVYLKKHLEHFRGFLTFGPKTSPKITKRYRQYMPILKALLKGDFLSEDKDQSKFWHIHSNNIKYNPSISVAMRPC